jgi:hypothetical protein
LSAVFAARRRRRRLQATRNVGYRQTKKLRREKEQKKSLKNRENLEEVYGVTICAIYFLIQFSSVG